MASIKEDSHQEEPHKDSLVQQELRCSSERNHVEALLAISDEVFLKQLQSFEAQPGHEEAVRGWDRVSTVGCTLQPQQRESKAHLDSSNLSAHTLTDPSQPNMNTHNSDQQHTSSSQKTMSNAACIGPRSTFSLSVGEKKETIRTSTQTFPRTVKPQKPAQKPNITVVPIKNFTFLPLIKTPQSTSEQVCSSKKRSEEILQYISDRKNCAKGLRADASQDLGFYHVNQTSRYTAAQQSFLFTSVSASVPKKHLTLSKDAETVHYSIGKGVAATVPANTAASARVNVHTRCLFS